MALVTQSYHTPAPKHNPVLPTYDLPDRTISRPCTSFLQTNTVGEGQNGQAAAQIGGVA